jgi:Omp85 superfamily domain
MVLACRSIVVLTLALLCAFAAPASAQRQTSAQDAPLVLDLATEPQGFVAEPEVVRRVVIFADRNFSGSERNAGFYADTKSMIPGSGWIGGGPGYRQWYANEQIFVDASAAISWRGYKTAEAQFELPKMAHSRLAVGTQFRWQDFPQVAFFGGGPSSLQANHSEYRLRSTDVIGYGTVQPLKWVDITGTIGWLTPSILPRAGTFQRDLPDTQQLFPTDPVFAVSEQPSFLHSGASITADTRDFPDHPTAGVFARAAMANYSDREAGLFSFRRYEAEAAHFVPLANSRVVLALHGWLIASDTDEGQVVPFYLAPSYGGNKVQRSYADYRFHDRNVLAINIETRIVLLTHVDAALMFDAGNVAPRIGDLDFGRRSYGAGLRLHTRRRTIARFDVAHGGEGWRCLFSVSDPLNLSRVERRMATAPFVP